MLFMYFMVNFRVAVNGYKNYYRRRLPLSLLAMLILEMIRFSRLGTRKKGRPGKKKCRDESPGM